MKKMLLVLLMCSSLFAGDPEKPRLATESTVKAADKAAKKTGEEFKAKLLKLTEARLKVLVKELKDHPSLKAEVEELRKRLVIMKKKGSQPLPEISISEPPGEGSFGLLSHEMLVRSIQGETIVVTPLQGRTLPTFNINGQLQQKHIRDREKIGLTGFSMASVAPKAVLFATVPVKFEGMKEIDLEFIPVFSAATVEEILQAAEDELNSIGAVVE